MKWDGESSVTCKTCRKEYPFDKVMENFHPAVWPEWRLLRGDCKRCTSKKQAARGKKT
jgi:hypothetical protein